MANLKNKNRDRKFANEKKNNRVCKKKLKTKLKNLYVLCHTDTV